MKSYHQAFKAYDIRGLYQRDIDEQFTYLMGKALGKWQQDSHANPQILIAADPRPANNSLIYAFIGGLRESGIEEITIANFPSSVPHPEGAVLDRGTCSTSMMYVLTQHDYDLGISFTASHNSKEYVGMKCCDKDVTLISTTFLRSLFEEEQQKHMSISIPKTLEGLDIIGYESLQDKKTDHFAQLSVLRKNTPGYTFVVDYANGAGVGSERDFFAQLSGQTVYHLNDYPDGTFPVHESETQHAENYQQIIQTIKEKNADFGIMFDGDADRIGVVTNTGTIIPGDVITAIIAKQVVEQNTRQQSSYTSLVLYDVMSSKHIENVVKDAGGTTDITRVGRFFINTILKEKNGLFAGECSGHYLFAPQGGYEIPLLAISYIVEELRHFDSMEAMYEHYRGSYRKSPVYDREVFDKEATLKTIRSHYSQYPVMQMDGVNVMADTFRITVRSSNTSDKMRYCVEVFDPKDYDKRLAELKSLIELFAK